MSKLFTSAVSFLTPTPPSQVESFMRTYVIFVVSFLDVLF